MEFSDEFHEEIFRRALVPLQREQRDEIARRWRLVFHGWFGWELGRVWLDHPSELAIASWIREMRGAMSAWNIASPQRMARA